MTILSCSSYCTGESYDLTAISRMLTTSQLQHKFYAEDVLQADLVAHSGDHHGTVFIFTYGGVVFWGLDATTEGNFLKQIETYLFEVLQSPVLDRCYYKTDQQLGDSSIDAEGDCIVLHSNSPDLKLPFSYALSQSVKLAFFADSVKKTIEENKGIPYELMEKGKISMSRKELAKKIGVLFLERSFIALNSDVFDVPPFFWKKPQLESYYEMTVKFLDIHQRTEMLNERLNVIHELYEMLSAEMQHSHSARLELIIIVLIFIEVVLSMIRDF